MVSSWEIRKTYDFVVPFLQVLFSVIQVLPLLALRLACRITFAVLCACLGTSMSVLAPSGPLVVIDERSGPAPISMLHSTDDESVACELGTKTAVCGSLAS